VSRDDRELLGMQPIYKPERGQIVTQAFIICSECGAMVSSTMGPRRDALCVPCARALLQSSDAA
jgi:formylmethanofuran dehydrogenase subunit E